LGLPTLQINGFSARIGAMTSIVQYGLRFRGLILCFRGDARRAYSSGDSEFDRPEAKATYSSDTLQMILSANKLAEE
jgi:hypothetical protein